MHVHRIVHARSFTVLPNGLLQDRRLSYTARGLLADLLSRPDGWREDGRQMADTSTQGRGVIRRALKELTDAGYYRVVKCRTPEGRIRSEAHVFDTPQLVPRQATFAPLLGGQKLPDAALASVPGVAHPVPGRRETGPADAPSVKDPVKEPTLPGEPDGRLRSAVLTLFRVLRPEPRLRLGEVEALRLAPLVAEWLERGSTAADLARALLPGLPAVMNSPAGILRARLHQKMPPAPVRSAERPAYAECAACHDPVPKPGICRPCTGLGTRTVAVGGGAAVTLTGAARARAALHDAKAAAGTRVVASP